MVEPSLFSALAMTILWPAAVVYCTVKYLAAFRRKAKVEAWFWFLCWCAMISMIEWFILFVMDLVSYAKAFL